MSGADVNHYQRIATILSQLLHVVNAKQLKRSGSDLFIPGEWRSHGIMIHRWKKYKSIQKFVISMEGVEMTLAAAGGDSNTIQYLVRFVSEYNGIKDLEIDTSIIEFTNSKFLISDAGMVMDTKMQESGEVQTTEHLVKLDMLLVSADVGTTTALDSFFEPSCKDFGLAVFGYILCPTPLNVWDNVAVNFDGCMYSIDEVLKLLKLFLGDLMHIVCDDEEFDPDQHISRTVVITKPKWDMGDMIAHGRYRGKDVRSRIILLQQNDDDGAEFAKAVRNRVVTVRFAQRKPANPVPEHVWIQYLPGIIKAIALAYRTTSDELLLSNQHPSRYLKKPERKRQRSTSGNIVETKTQPLLKWTL